MAAALATAGVLVCGITRDACTYTSGRALVSADYSFIFSRGTDKSCETLLQMRVSTATGPAFLYDVPRFAVPASFSHILRVVKERLVIRDKSRSNIPPRSRDDPAVVFF